MNFPTPKLNELIELNQGLISLWGDFGVGKTTFALQTAIHNAKLGKKIIFFYSKPNFPSVKIGLILKDSPMELLENIIFLQITNFEDFVSSLFNLEFLILENLKEKESKFNLIVIDSLTEIYRLELNKEKKEKNVNLNYKLNQILATFTYLFESYSVEVLVVNEMSRKRIEDEIFEVQSGGKIMNFWIANNIKIERTETLSERKLIITNTQNNKKFEVQSKLNEYGFE